MADLFANSDAIISECGRYRYRLERTVADKGPVYGFFGVNPSTADASIDDATVRKWKGFVSRWGGSRFIVGNIYAFRSTDVKGLAEADDPVGPDNPEHIMHIANACDILVPCWGDRNKLPRSFRPDADVMMDYLREFDKPIMAFGFSKGGDPLHPLMLSYDTQLHQVAA